MAWVFPRELESLAIAGSSVPDNFASKCIVTPIVTSSNFMVQGLGGDPILPGPGGQKFDIHEYGRQTNPTRSHLESFFAQLEGCSYALAYGSGNAALGAAILTMEKGDHILASFALYGGSTDLLRESTRFGLLVDFFQCVETDKIIQLLKPNTKMVYFESPSNPDLRLLDIQEICTRVHAVNPNIVVCIDNTFLTPVLQSCIALGADMVVYSTSKYIGGHADIIGGMVTTNSEALYKKLRRSQEVWGGVPSPYDCYLVIRSLVTITLRMEKHYTTGLKVAEYLQTHPLVEKVVHPGLKTHPQHKLALKQQKGHSGMVGFYLKGGSKEVINFMKSIKMVRAATSLGAHISLCTIPKTMSHPELTDQERYSLGITDNFLRLSVGMEKPEDLMKDLDQALRKSCM